MPARLTITGVTFHPSRIARFAGDTCSAKRSIGDFRGFGRLHIQGVLSSQFTAYSRCRCRGVANVARPSRVERWERPRGLGVKWGLWREAAGTNDVSVKETAFHETVKGNLDKPLMIHFLISIWRGFTFSLGVPVALVQIRRCKELSVIGFGPEIERLDLPAASNAIVSRGNSTISISRVLYHKQDVKRCSPALRTILIGSSA